MIIRHRYKYVFVELPHTGSTAISEELRELYDGSGDFASYFPPELIPRARWVFGPFMERLGAVVCPLGWEAFPRITARVASQVIAQSADLPSHQPDKFSS